jgi:predicted nucleotidyltransferase component of viral defense system
VKKASNLAASIRQRLLNRSRESGMDFNATLTRYGIERLLFRIGISRHADRFCLKGAHLFAVWTGHLHRPTRDVDFLAFGSSDPQDVVGLFREVLTETETETETETGTDDGLVFALDSITATDIREEQEYDGVRVKLVATLAGARIPLQIDLGFGDAITPGPEDVQIPVLIDLPAPKLRAYPVATVIAEKLEALTSLGATNSRMKDFFDLWTIARLFQPEAEGVVQAIRNTFERRKTRIQIEPMGLTEAFWGDDLVRTRWKAFVEKSTDGWEGHPVGEILTTLRAFLLPLLGSAAVAEGTVNSSVGRWNPSTVVWEESYSGSNPRS